jgi:hypothetical protein
MESKNAIAIPRDISGIASVRNRRRIAATVASAKNENGTVFRCNRFCPAQETCGTHVVTGWPIANARPGNCKKSVISCLTVVLINSISILMPHFTMPTAPIEIVE